MEGAQEFVTCYALHDVPNGVFLFWRLGLRFRFFSRSYPLCYFRYFLLFYLRWIPGILFLCHTGTAQPALNMESSLFVVH